jgi:uncharacterized protein (DUF169 family)
MDLNLKNDFLTCWEKYFPGAELPFTFFWSDDLHGAQPPRPSKEWSCVIGGLAQVRKGKSLAYDGDALGCAGAKRYLGFSETLRPDFKYFLSYGIPGQMEGERYVKDPEAVKKLTDGMPFLGIKEKYIIFKRWDALDPADEPEAAVFIAPIEVLSGLFTLANFEEDEPNGVICPFASGCGSIVYYPYVEQRYMRPHAVLGMFDPSARPYIPQGSLSFSVPMKKFARMIRDMDESFLITPTWETMKKRMKAGRQEG